MALLKERVDEYISIYLYCLNTKVMWTVMVYRSVITGEGKDQGEKKEWSLLSPAFGKCTYWNIIPFACLTSSCRFSSSDIFFFRKLFVPTFSSNLLCVHTLHCTYLYSKWHDIVIICLLVSLLIIWAAA